MRNKVEIMAVKGGITQQPDIMAIVNAANAHLTTGGGVAGAIHHAAGNDLFRECQDLAPIKPGEAVITKAYNLPNDYVIHCLGPVYGKNKPEDVLLAKCYTNVLRLAEKNQITSIAFPAISTGAFGFPMEAATGIAIKTILAELPSLKHVEKIKFVLFSQEDLDIYQKKLAEVQ
ncbi:macro domain-containing protein [Salegentibacter sp. F188]|uniref:Macro domain-containing protein n=1 Tax=Autumnicola patrickiae TaxID=3075591 RepID=A0ABU3E193_9FLAO|nr:macro domain-containing protein [Salegentibacter sp. F188]MDT0689737.1 macro domain-containing protein [Salegentibacter sp. F188]